MKSALDKIQYSDESPTCACKVSLDYLGDKWILIIIRDLFRYRFTFTHFLKESKEILKDFLSLKAAIKNPAISTI